MKTQNQLIQEAYTNMFVESFNETDEVFYHPRRLHLVDFKEKHITPADHDEAIKYHQSEQNRFEKHPDYPYSGTRAAATYNKMRIAVHKKAKDKLA